MKMTLLFNHEASMTRSGRRDGLFVVLIVLFIVLMFFFLEKFSNSTKTSTALQPDLSQKIGEIIAACPRK